MVVGHLKQKSRLRPPHKTNQAADRAHVGQTLIGRRALNEAQIAAPKVATLRAIAQLKEDIVRHIRNNVYHSSVAWNGLERGREGKRCTLEEKG
jgi:hypothetical protein